MSFRLKTVIGIAAIEIVLLAILVVSGLHYLRTSNETELLRSGRVTAALFATMITDAVVATDLATLDSLIDLTVRNEGLAYVRVRAADGRVLSGGGQEDALSAEFVADRTIADTRNDDRLDLAAPIIVSGHEFGRVEIGLSTSPLQDTISEAFAWMMSIAALEIALVAIFGVVLGGILTQQLAHLRSGARRVAAGEFGYQAEVRGKDEFADTTDSFNKMSQALADFAHEAREARNRAEAGRQYAESVLHDAMNSMAQGVAIVNAEERVEFLNAAFRNRYRGPIEALGERAPFAQLCAITLPQLIDGKAGEVAERVAARIEKLRDADNYAQWQTHHQNGQVLITSQRRMSSGGVVVVESDITELQEAHERNRLLELELLQSQRMESLGTLASGIAHEINTPLQYVSDNIQFLKESFGDIESALDDLIAWDRHSNGAVRTALEKMDWDFLSKEIPVALKEAGEGTKAVSRIVQSVKEFSRPEAKEMTIANLKEIVENAIVVSRNQWKYTAQVTGEFDESLTPVLCFPSQLAQVLVNLIVNAAQAIEDSASGKPGEIRIRTARNAGCAEIHVSDNGPGIRPELIGRIFDPFFTTKAPGKGAGQGLAVSKSVVEGKHGGKLLVDSELGKGTTFVVRLPYETSQLDLLAPPLPSRREAAVG